MSNAFVTELNLTGTDLLYSTYLGGSGGPDFGDYGYGIVVDTSGNTYVAGDARSSDFPITPNAFQTTFGGGLSDAFVTELDPTGSVLLYSSYLGGGASDYGRAIAVDASGNAFLTGFTSSSDFPISAGAFQMNNGGDFDGYVTEFDSTGSALVYSTYLGSRGDDRGYGIAVDTSGNAYVTGFTTSRRFPITLGAFQTTLSGRRDAFVAKFSASQIELIASSQGAGETVMGCLNWTGANSTEVDIDRDGVTITTVPNSGRYKDTLTSSGRYTYKVCETGTMNCSNEITVRGP